MPNSLSNSGKFLSSPVSFLLIGLWITNDHIGKWQFHNELTGKVSDITGLIVFPFLLTNLTFIFTKFIFSQKIREEIVFVLMNLSIVTLFSIINWNQDWNNWVYANFFGNQNGIADKTDLLCIPFCMITNFYFYKKYSKKKIAISSRINFLHLIAIILSTLAFINTSRIDNFIDSERNQYFPILIARPTNHATYKIKEEVSFIWYTEGNFKEFQIYIFPENERQNKITIPLLVSQLERYLDTRINKYYYVHTEKFSIEAGKYRLAITGNIDSEWKKKSLDLYEIIQENKCFLLKLSCTEFRRIGFEE